MKTIEFRSDSAIANHRERIMADYLHLALLGMAVALAGGYAGMLYVRYCHQTRGDRLDRRLPGHGIDAAGISNRVHRPRGDYVGERPSRRRDTSRRARLLTLASRAICQLPYFRGPASLNDPSNERDAEGPSA